ncbi:MAG: pentapeptide repeat-containing protein [bacterium]
MTDLILKQPAEGLNRLTQVDYSGFFKSLRKAALSGTLGNLEGVAEASWEAVRELGFKDSPEQAAWVLVSRSLMQALAQQIHDDRHLLRQPSEDDTDTLAEQVNQALNRIEISIDARFFDQPQNLSLLTDFKPALTDWLMCLGMNQYEAAGFYQRLRGSFVLALHTEWKKNRSHYECITAQMDTPFTRATLTERSWFAYRAWLQTQANAPVFNEAFGLQQVYIRLRAYYKQKKGKQIKKVVVDLHHDIETWVKIFDKHDALRVISGGPGSGKSSFAKILAGELAEKNNVAVLFVPLHHFNLKDDLVEAMAAFIEYDPYLSTNPLDSQVGQQRLLMIFDGLDELSMRGRAAAETAQDFVDEVIRTLDRQNHYANKQWQAIITGRELAIQANESRLRKSHQVFYLLPYYFHFADNLFEPEWEWKWESEWKWKWESESVYEDPNDLLATDQRDLWWQQFAQAKGKAYAAMPDELKFGNLQPTTCEPLLNYLLALSYERQQVSFNEDTHLNAIYFDLLQAVHERAYESCQHYGQQLAFGDFLRVLEEVAIAVWQGNGRTVSTRELIKRCEAQHLGESLAKFSEDAKQGVVRLLTAFYFREAGKNAEGEATFEFTHKSFGEYLTARRIVEEVALIAEEVARYQRYKCGGLTLEDALIKWVRLCGEAELDKYILQFIRDEVAIRAEQGVDIQQWQQVFLALLSLAVREYIPMEKMGQLSFAAMLQHSRHAEIALLAIHFACTQHTQTVLAVDWGTNIHFSQWLKRVVSQRTLNEVHLVLRCLAWLNLSRQVLSFTDLRHANLRQVNFSQAKLREAKLRYTDLRYADLSETNLISANFRHADLSETNLRQADLRHANLRHADLSQADLRHADLRHADLRHADLRHADLRHADLRHADLRHADLSQADLRHADLSKADLSKADFFYAKIEGANFEETVLADKTVEEITYRLDGDE